MGVTLQDFVSLLKFQSSFYRLGLTPDASFRPCLPTPPRSHPSLPLGFLLPASNISGSISSPFPCRELSVARLALWGKVEENGSATQWGAVV